MAPRSQCESITEQLKPIGQVDKDDATVGHSVSGRIPIDRQKAARAGEGKTEQVTVTWL